MSINLLSKQDRNKLHKAIRGHETEIAERVNKSPSTIWNALKGFYHRNGKKVPYHNEEVIMAALDIAEEIKIKREATRKRIKELS